MVREKFPALMRYGHAKRISLSIARISVERSIGALSIEIQERDIRFL